MATTVKRKVVKPKVKKVTRAKVAKVAKPTKTASKPKAKTVKTTRRSKGKARGASGAGKFVGKYIKKVWDDARAKGRKPTTAEKSKAFKDGWADYKKSIK